MKWIYAKGFTLIELMIVIAIISILTAISSPNFISSRKKTMDATIRVLMSEIASLEKEYRAEMGGYLAAPQNPSDSFGAWNDSGPWKDLKFKPMQNLYGYSFKIEATRDTFTVVAIWNGKEKYFATHDYYGITEKRHPESNG